MPTDNLVKFKSGTQQQYNDLETKDESTLYFINDELKIYKGSKLYVKSFWTGTNSQKPETGEEGILYVITDENKMYTWKPEESSGSYELAFQSSAVTLDDTVTENSTNGVTSKAIYTYVTNEIAKIVSGGGAEGVFVTQVTESENVGTLTIHRGEETNDVKVKLTGLAKLPTYDKETRKITFQNADEAEAEVVIDLGKDLVVQSGSYSSETKEIILVLNDESSTQVKISVADLVSEYSASTDVTGAVQLTISNGDSGKEIKAALQIDDASKLKITDNKLTIDLSDYATSAALQEVSSKVTQLETTVQGLDETYVKSEDLESKLADYAKTSEIQGQITTVTESVTELETKINQSLTWGTINV